MFKDIVNNVSKIQDDSNRHSLDFLLDMMRDEIIDELNLPEDITEEEIYEIDMDSKISMNILRESKTLHIISYIAELSNKVEELQLDNESLINQVDNIIRSQNDLLLLLNGSRITKNPDMVEH